MSERIRIQTKCWGLVQVHPPVPGWDAIETTLKVGKSEMVQSYVVLECPEFVRDASHGGQFRVRRKKHGPAAAGGTAWAKKSACRLKRCTK